MTDCLAEHTKLWEVGHSSSFIISEFYSHGSPSMNPHLVCFSIHIALLHWHSHSIRGKLVPTSEYTRNSCKVKVCFWRKYKIQIFKNRLFIFTSVYDNVSLMVLCTTFIPAPSFHKDGHTKMLLNTINHIYELRNVENVLRGPLRVTGWSSANRIMTTAPVSEV